MSPTTDNFRYHLWVEVRSELRISPIHWTGLIKLESDKPSTIDINCIRQQVFKALSDQQVLGGISSPDEIVNVAWRTNDEQFHAIDPSQFSDPLTLENLNSYAVLVIKRGSIWTLDRVIPKLSRADLLIAFAILLLGVISLLIRGWLGHLNTDPITEDLALPLMLGSYVILCCTEEQYSVRECTPSAESKNQTIDIKQNVLADVRSSKRLKKRDSMSASRHKWSRSMLKSIRKRFMGRVITRSSETQSFVISGQCVAIGARTMLTTTDTCMHRQGKSLVSMETYVMVDQQIYRAEVVRYNMKLNVVELFLHGDVQLHALEAGAVPSIIDTQCALLSFDDVTKDLGAFELEKSTLEVASLSRRPAVHFSDICADSSQEGNKVDNSRRYSLVHTSHLKHKASGGAVISEAGQLIGLHVRNEENSSVLMMAASLAAITKLDRWITVDANTQHNPIDQSSLIVV